MVEQTLEGMKVAIIVENGFEQVEMTKPREALKKAGAETILISPAKDKVRGWKTTEWGDKFPVDLSLDNARASDFDALLLPGGVISADKLRMNEKVVNFVKEFFDDAKPVASICHAPWVMVDANVINGRTLTSWPSLRVDLENAGAIWEDKEMVHDDNLVSSRKPGDIPAFNRAMVSLFANARLEDEENHLLAAENR